MARGLWWLLALVWAGLIFAFSHLPDAPDHFGFWLYLPHADKAIHAAIFGLLAGLLLKATQLPPLALWLTMLYGVTDELHQGFVIGRQSDVADWLADSIGALLVIIFLRMKR